ncbi:MAG: hydrogenase small subunit [Planctomycetota bacterium]|jgi:hydrogenase small subunit
MNVTRRDFLRASAAIAGALALKASGLMQLQKAMATGGGKPPVIWLQGQGCTGCSVSLLNSIYYMTIDQLLINTLDVKFHPTVMAAAGEEAINVATGVASGYVLVIEGAIPRGANGEYCHIWDGMTMIDALELFAQDASSILAVGTCACYGGMSAGEPNPTDAMGVDAALRSLGHRRMSVINIPGCPAHPDWIVGTVAGLLAGEEPDLDKEGRPKEFFGNYVHKMCPNRGGGGGQAKVLSDPGCLSALGCNGQQTHADCPLRKWNAAGPGEQGVNWCVGARNPCQGCTEPDFPDGMSPFYHL